MLSNIICIVCPNSCTLNITRQGEKITVEGAKCERGVNFAKEELISPKRTLCTTVLTSFKEMPVLPVRTNGEVPKELIFKIIDELKYVNVNKIVSRGDVIVKNVLNTGVDVISTSDMHIFLTGG